MKRDRSVTNYNVFEQLSVTEYRLFRRNVIGYHPTQVSRSEASARQHICFIICFSDYYRLGIIYKESNNEEVPKVLRHSVIFSISR